MQCRKIQFHNDVHEMKEFCTLASMEHEMGERTDIWYLDRIQR